MIINFIMSVCPSIHPSVCPSTWNKSAPTGRIFTKFHLCVFFEKSVKEFEFHYNVTRITGTSHKDQYTFMIISHSVILRMINVSDKRCREYQNVHFMFHNPSQKIAPFMRYEEEYCGAGQATDDSVAHGHCILDT